MVTLLLFCKLGHTHVIKHSYLAPLIKFPEKNGSVWKQKSLKCTQMMDLVTHNSVIPFLHCYFKKLLRPSL